MTAGAGAASELLEAYDLGPLRLRNRVVMSAHTGALPHDRYVGYLRERAAGGAALIVVGGANAGLAEYGPLRGFWGPGASTGFDFIGPNPATDAGRAYYDDLVTPMLAERAAAVHEGGALAVGQVFHLGAYREVDTLHVGVGPSAGPDPDGFGATYELEPEEIEELVTAYAAGVARVRAAGLDGAEIHAAHGFLVNAFLTPGSNRRDDAWGGDAERRAAFLLRILAGAREVVGPDFPIGLRVAADDVDPDGLGTQELIDVVRRAEPYLTYVSVSGGSVSGARAGLAYASSRYTEPGHNLPAAAAVRRAVRVPVMAAGRLLTPERAAAAIRDGACDLVAMARPFIADPAWVRKLAEGRRADVAPCIGANECHMYHGFRSHMTCAVNPRAGRERELPTGASTPSPSGGPASVLVIGGGPAGLEAAAVAAEAGHAVVLVERCGELGGRLHQLARDPAQDRLLEYLAYQRGRLTRAGAELRLGAELEPEALLGLGSDAIVVAIGSDDPLPPPGSGPAWTTSAEVLVAPRPRGRVLVVGGLEDHLETATTAELLATRGDTVIVTTEWDRLAPHGDPMTRTALLRSLRGRGVAVRPLTRLVGLRSGGAELADVLTGAESTEGALDAVVLCGARTPRRGLFRALRQRHPRVVAVGDCLAPRRIVHAVLDGHRVAAFVTSHRDVVAVTGS